MKLANLWNDFVDLIFPRCCEACDQSLVGNELVICTACRVALPRVKTDSILNDTLKDKFAHMPEVAGIASFLLFTKKGKVQKLLHALKYKGRSEVGTEMGFMFGQELSEGNQLPDAELIISVPLHKKRSTNRGLQPKRSFGGRIFKSHEYPLVGNNSDQNPKHFFANWEDKNGKAGKCKRCIYGKECCQSKKGYTD